MLDFGLRALSDYPAVVDELERACGFDLELRVTGILNVAFDDGRRRTPLAPRVAARIGLRLRVAR